MSNRRLGRNWKAIVGVGVLVLFVVAGVAGTVTADTTPAGISIDRTEGESVVIVIVDMASNDSISLGAPNGNRSIPLKESQGFYASTSIMIVDTPENRTVPAENYLTTGATKTEEQTCWISHGPDGLELGDGIRVNKSVDIPCDGGEIAGPQNLASVGGSDDTVLIESGDEIEYQNGTYGVLIRGGDGEVRRIVTFTVGSGGPGEYLYDRPYGNDNSLYNILGIITVGVLLVMTALLAAVGIREVLAE